MRQKGFYSRLNSELTVIVPVRLNGTAEITLNYLGKQTYKDFIVYVVHDRELRGASWARNRGLEIVTSPFVLFSDDDIEWEPNALEVLVSELKNSPDNIGYTYGWWEMNGLPRSAQPFSPYNLVRGPYISTMSVFRSEIVPEWDENLPRLQDWDVYLKLLKKRVYGRFCNHKVFTTQVRDGITFGSKHTFDEVKKIVEKKHNLEAYL